MNIEEFAHRVIELTPQMVKGFVQDQHNYLTRGEITLPQFWVLHHLYSNGKSKMNCLAKHLGISPAATTGLVDRLILQKLVAREHDSQDRRIVWIELTSKGKEVLMVIRRQKTQSVSRVFSKVSSKDREHYLKILEQVASVSQGVIPKDEARSGFLIFVLILPVACFSQESQALTLKECYQLALIQSELTKIDTEHIKQAEAHFLQAFGTIMPQVSFSRTHLWETSATASKNSSFEQAFVFKQTLFSGFKEFAGISGGKLEKKQRENEKLRGEQLLFVDVSDAFYLLLEVREDLKTLETIRKAFTDRIDELKTRTDLGKSRQSEVVNTETQLYSLEDQIALVKSQEALARELLEFLIGRRISEIVEPVASFSLKPESEYLAAASRRADVLAADFAWQVDKKNMAITKSGFFPSVNLEGDYFGHRNTVPRDSRWRTQLSIDIPIFEGTTTFGKYKEAVSKARESELLFKRSGRVAENEIQNAYSNAQAALARAALLEKALTSAELNYKLQLEDYQLNVVNNLEVLTAIQDLENIRRNFNHVSYEGKRFYWQLQVAAGEIDLSRL